MRDLLGLSTLQKNRFLCKWGHACIPADKMARGSGGGGGGQLFEGKAII